MNKINPSVLQREGEWVVVITLSVWQLEPQQKKIYRLVGRVGNFQLKCPQPLGVVQILKLVLFLNLQLDL